MLSYVIQPVKIERIYIIVRLSQDAGRYILEHAKKHLNVCFAEKLDSRKIRDVHFVQII